MLEARGSGGFDMVNDKAARLLSIVQEIYEGGKDVIGPRWVLFDTMKGYANRGDVEGMKTYYERCLANTRGRAVAERLRRKNRKTLESEWPRFVRIYQSSS
jgi:hypothetical protein